MRIHLISIGGAAMHNIAMALHQNGHHLSGSDDEIYEPSRSRLASLGLLPESSGWDPNRIDSELDLIILGMHAKMDNPELKKALQLGIPVMSFPEYIYTHAKDKKRVVIAGSHGKTTTTSMIMHVLKKLKYNFDFLVGAQIEGFDTMAKFSDAPLMIIEGDEYLSSALDSRPKMLHYKPHIAILTGIAWDHINVFPDFNMYVDQFKAFIGSIEKGGHLYYYGGDREIKKIIEDQPNPDIITEAYDAIETGNDSDLLYGRNVYRTKLFGAHNRQNMMAALLVCEELGVKPADYFAAMASFTGASKRLQLIQDLTDRKVYLDFAHAPSKVKATIEAMKEKFPEKLLTIILELHTYSSLNPAFLKEYSGTLQKADKVFLFVDPNSLKKKNIETFSESQLRKDFNQQDLIYLQDSSALEQAMESIRKDELVLLMSSGKFGNLDIKQYL